MFKVRTTLPTLGDKLYNNKNNGGLSGCIDGKCKSTGKPYDGLNVLANCCGWACSRYNEIYNEITGYNGMKYPDFNCNASKFIEYRVKNPNYYPELQVVDYPVVGGIMVMDNGGAGHVMIVEQILERDSKGKPTKIFTSESGWNGVAFRNVIREYDNNHWEMASSYKCIGCIVNPAVGILEPTNTVIRDEKKDQLQVLTTLYIRAEAGTEYPALGLAVENGVYDYFEKKEVGEYTWYKIAEHNWVAQNKNNTYLAIYEKKKEEEKPKEDSKEVEELKDRIIGLEKENQDLKEEIASLDKQLENLIHNITNYKYNFDIPKDGTYKVTCYQGENITIYPSKEHEYKITLYTGDVLKIK